MDIKRFKGWTQKKRSQKAVVCANCVYFSRHITDEDWGNCHYYPPTPNRIQQGLSSDVPRVHFDEWCGMYREKQNDADRGQNGI